MFTNDALPTAQYYLILLGEKNKSKSIKKKPNTHEGIVVDKNDGNMWYSIKKNVKTTAYRVCRKI